MGNEERRRVKYIAEDKEADSPGMYKRMLQIDIQRALRLGIPYNTPIVTVLKRPSKSAFVVQ